MDPDTLQVRKMAETRLLLRAMDDPDFHARLISDPRAAFEEELGTKFPAAAKLQVIEETADTVVLVVPKRAVSGERELTEDELEGVVGGSMLDSIGSALSDAWGSVKKALSGGKYEVQTERAVAGVRG